MYLIETSIYTNAMSISGYDNWMNEGVSVKNNKTVEQIIGKRIQIIRKNKGFTQQQFAEKIGLSTNYISDIERGKSSARLDKLVLIINTLGCTADDVFADVIESGYKVKSSRLSDLLEELPKEEKEKAFAILEAFLSKSTK
ncbi:MAG: helix-turn-helix transcriptional regulator [Acutalibacteraceae bacterium]|nr:helix-turn-helix transcriptional regulator [Acutalibacteraceae bacterium]